MSTPLFIIALTVLVILLVLVIVRSLRRKKRIQKTPVPFSLNRNIANPIISPLPYNEWELGGTFNPAVLQDKHGIHIFYRAMGSDGVSRVGYARSSDGTTIIDRSEWPVYSPTKDFEGMGKPSLGFQPGVFHSGGGWGGSEDPKVTEIDGKVYMTYVANGGDQLRIGLTTISADDLAAQRWNWSQPQLISKPNEINKSCIILPEKVKGKFVIFHRVFPDILIDYISDMNEFGHNNRWLDTKDRIRVRPGYWDSLKLSVGATPIKTEWGWLTIYHAIDEHDSGKYKIGAMILKIDDPATVLYRSPLPILSPELPYENNWKPGVAYPSGAAIINDELFVYYGGGDKYVCVAHTPVKALVDWLMTYGRV